MKEFLKSAYKGALHRKMEKLEKKLLKYANVYFEENVTIMYLKNKNKVR